MSWVGFLDVFGALWGVLWVQEGARKGKLANFAWILKVLISVSSCVSGEERYSLCWWWGSVLLAGFVFSFLLDSKSDVRPRRGVVAAPAAAAPCPPQPAARHPLSLAPGFVLPL